MKIMVAMSGGVDSSVAAALLKEAGHEVTGVTMHLWDDRDERLAESLCCAQEMAESARRVAAQLEIPYYVFNYQAEFRRHVIEYFLREYTIGFTPNPCLECNREIKFRALMNRAQALGFDAVATGHYAQIRSDHGVYRLLRAVDREKDQSYMLHMLQQRDLARILFPIGGFTKAQVRALAAERGLASADRPESQDICFVPGGDYRNLLREEQQAGLRPGPIIDTDGRELGRHEGLPFYTIGQRRGLHIAAGRPLYVTGKDIERNTLIVGPAAALERSSLRAERVTFVTGEQPLTPFECVVQIRAHATPVPARVSPTGPGMLEMTFAHPQRAITPGQAAVLYDGESVIGGGRIAA